MVRGLASTVIVVTPPSVWIVAIFLLGAVLYGTLQVLADEAPPAEAVSALVRQGELRWHLAEEYASGG